MNVETHHPYDPAAQLAFSRELNSRLYSRGTRLVATAGLFLIAMAPFIALLIWSVARDESPGLVSIVLAAVVALALRVYAGRWINLHFIRKLSSVVTLAGKDVRYLFDDKGIHGAMAHSTWSVEWPGVDRLVATKKGVMFIVSMGAYFVPSSAFFDAQALANFSADARDRLSQEAREKSLIEL
ncbi:MAG: hypothetical protein IV086_14125 [Hyphomonadaceae bacterium]|nr:MAG: hypothetical protein FD160_3580 [Caulobacteraceae bacterium]MBT9446835.1 hypothetical protein [Hyphomonadaceae bacterium]TPW03092.1 MAG: hypothetical protein FD124_3151 [Alphaproteobacteria bacterium]